MSCLLTRHLISNQDTLCIIMAGSSIFKGAKEINTVESVKLEGMYAFPPSNTALILPYYLAISL